MFPCMIARTTTTDVISSGVGGTRNGALQLVSPPLLNSYFCYPTSLFFSYLKIVHNFFSYGTTF